MRKLLVIFLFFFIFNELIAAKEETVTVTTSEGAGPGTPDKKKRKKEVQEAEVFVSEQDQAVDVREILRDIISKDEEISALTKSKSNYKLATTILASALGLTTALLIGGTGLVLYNHKEGKHPFSLCSKKGDKKGGDSGSASTNPEKGSGSGSGSGGDRE